MYAGAAVSAVPLIAALGYAGGIGAYHLHWGSRSLTAAQISHWRPLIVAVVILIGLVVPALWLLPRPASSAFFMPPGFVRMPPAMPAVRGGKR